MASDPRADLELIFVKADPSVLGSVSCWWEIGHVLLFPDKSGESGESLWEWAERCWPDEAQNKGG